MEILLGILITNLLTNGNIISKTQNAKRKKERKSNDRRNLDILNTLLNKRKAHI